MSCAPVDRMTPSSCDAPALPLFSSLVPSIPFDPTSVRQAGHLVIDLNSPWFLLSYLRLSSTTEALPPNSTRSGHPIRPRLDSCGTFPSTPGARPPRSRKLPCHKPVSTAPALKRLPCLMPSLYKELLYLALATTPIGRYYYLNFKERESVAEGGCVTRFRTHSVRQGQDLMSDVVGFRA